MTTDDYDQHGDTQLKALSAELWRNAMDSVDSLLVLLEQDAKGDRLYTELWKQSSYYYQHSDLIFRTAEELSHYITLDGARATYIQLTPGLRNVQNQYVETRIGHAMVKLLLSDKTPAGMDDELWQLFSRHIRLALANYANIELLRLKASSDKNSTQSRARSEMENDYHQFGDREMALALDVLFSNPEAFKDAISASTILQYEYQSKTSQSWKAYLASLEVTEEEPVKDGCKCECKTPKRKSYSSLCDIGGWHTM